MDEDAPKPKRADEYDAFREASGWYLAAWRDYRGLTLQDLADEVGTSRGMVNDLETGRPRKDGRLTRYNRNWVDLMTKALDAPEGHLIGVNPFSPNTDIEALGKFRKIAQGDRPRVLRLLDDFAKDASDG